MKRCPECRRDYVDDSLMYCLEDGTALIQGSVPASGESQTAILHEPAAPNDERTRTFEPAAGPATDAKRNSLIVAVIGIILVTLLGIGGYFYYGRVSTKQIDSIAVMPFVNESGNPDVEYLSDGMTEILIGSLSNLPNLNVKARTSVFRYKGKEIDPRQIATDLKVQAVVTGRIVQRANNVSLYVELIDADSENVLWKADYNRSMTDLVALQNEIAQDVSQKLRSKLTPADTQKLTQKNDTANPEAYRLYLQGRYYWNKRRIGEMGKAIGYFQQAIDIDPNYASAYAGLADAIAQPNDVVPPLERHEKAGAAVQKALSLDPDLAEAHTSLAHLLTRYDLDFVGAERELTRSLQLDPNWIDTYQRLGDLYTFQGRFEEAFNWYRRGLEIEPFNVPLNTAYGSAFYNSRRYDEAIGQAKKAAELDPNHRNAHVLLYQVYAAKGMYSDAVEHRITALRLADQNEWADRLRDGFAKSGWTGVLQEELRRFSLLGNNPDRLPHYNQAAILTLLGDEEKAFEALEKSLEAREQPALVFLKVDPRFDPLRKEARFAEFLQKVGFSK